MGHEAANEVYVTAEAVQLGDCYVALELLRGCESGLELRATVEGIRAFACLDFNELTGQLQALILRELMQRAPLGFKTNVTLVQGIRAHYQPLSCGGSCSPPWIAWKLNGVRYEIQAKTIKGSRAEFVALANAALAGGGRG